MVQWRGALLTGEWGKVDDEEVEGYRDGETRIKDISGYKPDHVALKEVERKIYMRVVGQIDMRAVILAIEGKE